jgi:hypothetical protein
MSTDPNTQVCMLAGHNKRGPEVLAFVQAMEPGHPVALVREPTNQFDKNAVQVYASNGDDPKMIGFIAKVHNPRVAAWLDQHPNDNDGLVAVFGYAGTGKSKVPAIKITFPEEIAS